MKIKKAFLVSIILIIALAITFLIFIQSCFLDVNKVHNFNNITDFEQYSQLTFIEVYDFDHFIENNKKELITNHKNIRIHYEDYDKNVYTVSIDESQSSYVFTFFLDHNKPFIDEENNTKIGQSYLAYFFNHESEEYYFTVTLDHFKYRISFKNNLNLSDSQLIEIIENYVSNNNKLNES